LLGKKKMRRPSGARASAFINPISERRRDRWLRRYAHSERTRKQRSERHQPHQLAHPREDSAFSLGDLAYRADLDPGSSC